ncbi:hypothetical protein FS837_012581 [Tulasnella sp. UAMH 9824]|nr:hypothetical protein FS837_012581 [Tulasnella sp. UAMH 9824]
MPLLPHDAPPPSNWPADIIHLNKQRYDPKLPPNVRKRIQSSGSVKPLQKSRLVKIQVITDPSHPARGQRGLFASQKIPPSTHILDYLGEVHSDERVESDYDLSLLQLPSPLLENDAETFISIGVDAMRMGNEARFINDYRGTGVAKPNVDFREREVDGELRMSVWSCAHGLRKGEELLVSYGKSWWKARNQPEESEDDGIP